jgi:hypothetical protein
MRHVPACMWSKVEQSQIPAKVGQQLCIMRIIFKLSQMHHFLCAINDCDADSVDCVRDFTVIAQTLVVQQIETVEYCFRLVHDKSKRCIQQIEQVEVELIRSLKKLPNTCSGGRRSTRILSDFDSFARTIFSRQEPSCTRSADCRGHPMNARQAMKN